MVSSLVKIISEKIYSGIELKSLDMIILYIDNSGQPAQKSIARNVLHFIIDAE